MKPQSKLALFGKAAALVVGGGAAAHGVHAAIDPASASTALAAGSIIKDILSAAAPILIAWLTRGPGH